MLHGRLTLRRLARTSSLTLLAALTFGAGAAKAAFPGQDGRILYIDHRQDLRVMQPDGTGDRIAYSYDGAGSSSVWGQYLPTGAAWSADGRMIAFTGYEFCDANCGKQHQTRVAIVGPDGGIPTTLVQQGVDDGADYPDSPSFSPDGKTVIYSGVDASGSRRLLTVPIGGGDPQPLPLPPGATDPGEPSFSPDGTRIAFTATETASHLSRVYVATADGANTLRLTSGGNGQHSPSWSADGTKIAYVGAVVDGNAQLAVRPSEGGAADIVYSDQREQGASANGVSWSPSGTAIVFGTYWSENPDSQCKSELRVIGLGGGSGASLKCAGPAPIGGVDWGPRPQPGDTRVVSRSSLGEREGGNDDTSDVSLAKGGRYAFYATRAGDVLDKAAADTNGASDVFRRDVASGEVALVSGDGDTTANGASDTPFGTPNGRFVAFRSTARNLIAGFEGGKSAVYEHDMDTGEISLVSRHLGKPKLGTEGDADPLAISDDGRYVLFATDATDVLAGQNEQDADRNLFRFDRQTGQTVPVDSTSAPAGQARMSADGRYVVFESNAGDLVDGFADRNGDAPSLFRRDLLTGDVKLVDGAETSATQGAADAPSSLRGFSADGQTVLFATDADDVVHNFSDQNGEAPDLYLRRLADQTTYLVSGFHSRPNQGADGTMLGTAALSADGKTVAFATDADLTGLAAQDNDVSDVFLRRYTPEPQPIELLTTGAKGYGYAANSPSSLDALSADGRHVLVRSKAQDLSLPVELHGHDVLYRIDWPSHDVTQVTEKDVQGPDAELEATAISGDGLTVVYRTQAGNLLDNWLDRNGDGRDVFAFVDHRIADVDVIPPDIAIETPAEGGIYRKGRTYEARYRCRDIGGFRPGELRGQRARGRRPRHRQRRRQDVHRHRDRPRREHHDPERRLPRRARQRPPRAGQRPGHGRRSGRQPQRRARRRLPRLRVRRQGPAPRPAHGRHGHDRRRQRPAHQRRRPLRRARRQRRRGQPDQAGAARPRRAGRHHAHGPRRPDRRSPALARRLDRGLHRERRRLRQRHQDRRRRAPAGRPRTASASSISPTGTSTCATARPPGSSTTPGTTTTRPTAPPPAASSRPTAGRCCSAARRPTSPRPTTARASSSTAASSAATPRSSPAPRTTRPRAPAATSPPPACPATAPPSSGRASPRT